MMAVKTNDEYRALQHEIEHAQKGIRKTEDDLLNLMMEAESLQSEIKTAEVCLKEDQQKVNEERKLLEEENKRDLTGLEVLRVTPSEGGDVEFVVSPASAFAWRSHLGLWAVAERQSDADRVVPG